MFSGSETRRGTERRREIRLKPVCGVCFIHTDTVNYVQTSNDDTKVSPGMDDMSKVSTTAQPSTTCQDIRN